jgi:alpha-beta hydrolase superfamily lysophospholipase
MKWLIVTLAVVLVGCEPRCESEPPGSIGEPTSWEADFLRERRLPRAPPLANLRAEDGLALAFSDYVPDGWRGQGQVVLFVHGSSARGALYSAMGEGLRRRGVFARLIDLRGHGGSRCVRPAECGGTSEVSFVDDGQTWPGRPGDAKDVSQHARDVSTHLTDLRTRYPAARLFLAGHSSGAGLVTRVVQTQGMSGLSGAMLLAPFIHPEQPQNDVKTWECGRVVGTTYARVDLGALGDAQRGNPHRYVLRLEKNPAYADPLDTLRYTYTTMLGLAATDPTSFHAAFTGPTLWVQGDSDALFELEASRAEFSRLPGGRAFVVVEQTSHVGVIWSDTVAGLLADFAVDPQASLPPRLRAP